MVVDAGKVCSLFYKKVDGDEDQFVCNCGTMRKQKKGSGYSNLMSHLRDKHSEWENIYNDFIMSNPKSKKPPAGHQFFIHPKVIFIYSWLDWVVTDNLPISIVEKQTYRNYSNLENVSVDTFTKYLKLVESRIDDKLREELPTKFGLIIDGWTEGNTHYFGVFAAYSKNGRNYERFLTIAPPFDETTFTAQTQADFLVDVMENIGRNKDDILYLVADNTNTNPATADVLGCNFIGCASHRFNLAVQRYLNEHQSLFGNIHQIMILLSSLKRAGKLRRLTPLEPVLMNVTRWSSKYAMLERYFRLEGFLKELDDLAVNILMPSGRELNQLKMVQKQLVDFNLITLKLQDPSITLLDVRLIFDEVILSYPEMEHYLAKDARIVKNPIFESAICKVLSKKPNLLSTDEGAAVSSFVIQRDEIVEVPHQTIIQRDLKRQRVDSEEVEKYCDLTCVPPTSNVCERLFSAAR